MADIKQSTTTQATLAQQQQITDQDRLKLEKDLLGLEKQKLGLQTRMADRQLKQEEHQFAMEMMDREDQRVHEANIQQQQMAQWDKKNQTDLAIQGTAEERQGYKMEMVEENRKSADLAMRRQMQYKEYESALMRELMSRQFISAAQMREAELEMIFDRVENMTKISHAMNDVQEASGQAATAMSRFLETHETQVVKEQAARQMMGDLSSAALTSLSQEIPGKLAGIFVDLKDGQFWGPATMPSGEMVDLSTLAQLAQQEVGGAGPLVVDTAVFEEALRKQKKSQWQPHISAWSSILEDYETDNFGRPGTKWKHIRMVEGPEQRGPDALTGRPGAKGGVFYAEDWDGNVKVYATPATMVGMIWGGDAPAGAEIDVQEAQVGQALTMAMTAALWAVQKNLPAEHRGLVSGWDGKDGAIQAVLDYRKYTARGQTGMADQAKERLDQILRSTGSGPLFGQFLSQTATMLEQTGMAGLLSAPHPTEKDKKMGGQAEVTAAVNRVSSEAVKLNALARSMSGVLEVENFSDMALEEAFEQGDKDKIARALTYVSDESMRKSLTRKAENYFKAMKRMETETTKLKGLQEQVSTTTMEGLRGMEELSQMLAGQELSEAGDERLRLMQEILNEMQQ